MTKTVDIHAHMLPEETIRLLGKESPRVAPKLIPQPDGSIDMEIAGKIVQKPMPKEIWDHDLRLADMDRHGVEQVEDFIDVVHSLDNLIDPYSPFIRRDEGRRGPEDASAREVKKIAAKDYMDRFINPPEFLASQKSKDAAAWAKAE